MVLHICTFSAQYAKKSGNKIPALHFESFLMFNSYGDTARKTIPTTTAIETITKIIFAQIGQLAMPVFFPNLATIGAMTTKNTIQIHRLSSIMLGN